MTMARVHGARTDERDRVRGRNVGHRRDNDLVAFAKPEREPDDVHPGSA